MQHQPMLKTHRKPEGTTTVVEVAGVRFGDGSYPVIAGPAVVDTEADFRAAAEIARDGGAAILRGGAFTRADTAYSYQGRGEEALHLLARVGEYLELPVMTGVTEPGHVDLVAAHADVLLIDGDDMQNFALLTAVGGVGRPVIIKRGQSATIDEWLLAAEYVLDAGNPNAILCEPGIRTFEPRTTNTLDISAVPVVQRLSHLPVIIDPSHAAGQTELVIPLALAGRAVGADGLMVEVHPQPSASAVGPGRHLDEAGYLALMEALGVPRLRDEIDRIDREIVRLSGGRDSPVFNNEGMFDDAREHLERRWADPELRAPHRSRHRLDRRPQRRTGPGARGRLSRFDLRGPDAAGTGQQDGGHVRGCRRPHGPERLPGCPGRRVDPGLRYPRRGHRQLLPAGLHGHGVGRGGERRRGRAAVRVAAGGAPAPLRRLHAQDRPLCEGPEGDFPPLRRPLDDGTSGTHHRPGGRGFLREGYKADLVVFDLDRLRDRATVLEPDLFSEGVDYVMVNGVFTVDGGEFTDALPGEVVLRPGSSEN